MIEATSDRETIRTHRLAGKSFHWIAREVRRSLPYVHKMCEGIPLGEKGTNYMIGRYIGSNPNATNEEVAAALGFDVELIATRRRLMRPKPIRKREIIGQVDDENTDKGRRLSRTWMRQNCSRGEKDLWQILAVVGSERITIAEIRASAIAAGLPIHPSNGRVGTPRIQPEQNTTCRERRFRVGSLGIKRRSY